MLKASVDLPLHYGNSPRWLFKRMTRLAAAITEVVVNEYGNEELLKRLSEPYWFQSFACVLGFDWHSSGTTTVTMAALKEALRKSELGEEIFVCGGKGKASLKTPEEIKQRAEQAGLSDDKIEELIKSSKLGAKVDSAALQDGFQLYHHSFVFTNKGRWAIIQQGMNNESGYARRYHWLSSPQLDFVNEPHAAIVCDKLVKPLNMVAREAEEVRKCCVDVVNDGSRELIHFSMPREYPKLKPNLEALKQAYEQQPKSYEELLLIKGIGPQTVRALALIANLIYGSQLCWRDPCKFAFAHGGKDGWPYPVNKKRYDRSIAILREAVQQAKLERKERLDAMKRLASVSNFMFRA